MPSMPSKLRWRVAVGGFATMVTVVVCSLVLSRSPRPSSTDLSGAPQATPANLPAVLTDLPSDTPFAKAIDALRHAKGGVDTERAMA